MENANPSKAVRTSCPECGFEYNSAVSGGLCPRCVLGMALDENSEPELVGKTVSHYEILERLGAGGMGLVYAARDRRLGRLVAIKFLPEGLLMDAAARRRFEHEARAASHLNHPHICAVYDVGEFEERPFIVMELSKGRTLREMLEDRTSEHTDLLPVCLQITEGLEAAHQHNVLHRDLKPANIFITKEGRAKILDFGLARELPSTVETMGETGLFGEVKLAGTLPYMAPELFEDNSGDSRSDLFSLGVVFYEMATGCCPFQRRTAQATIGAILKHKPEPPEKLNPNLSPAFGRVIQKLLEKDPDRRYPSCSAVRTDLEKLTSAIPPGQRAWTASKTLLLALLVALFALIPLWNTFRPGTTPPDSIAVLPFENLSGDPDQEYLADAMTDALITSLAQVQSLRVPSRTTMMRYKESKKSIRQIARELKVAAVVEGSVQRTGDDVLVRTRVIDAKTEASLLTRHLEHRFESIIDLQDEVARALVAGIRVSLTPSENERLGQTRPVQPKAYEAYLRGLYLLNRRENLDGAVDYFKESIRIEPTNALAHAHLAQTYLLLSAYASRPPEEIAVMAGDAATTALRLEPSLPEALVTSAAIQMQFKWDWREADRLFQEALNAAPSYALAHHWYALCLAAQGDLEGAREHVLIARELEPDSPLVGAALGRIYYYRREYDLAENALEAALELEPHFPPALLARGLVFLQQKRYDRALSDFHDGLRTWKEAAPLLESLEQAVREKPEVFPGLLRQLDRTALPEDSSPFVLAVLSSTAGDSAATIHYLELAGREHSEYVLFLDVDPLFDFLHNERRFLKLRKEIGLGGQSRQSAAALNPRFGGKALAFCQMRRARILAAVSGM